MGKYGMSAKMEKNFNLGVQRARHALESLAILAVAKGACGAIEVEVGVVPAPDVPGMEEVKGFTMMVFPKAAAERVKRFLAAEYGPPPADGFGSFLGGKK